MKRGDLVYIHDSFGPLPKDLFGIITRIQYDTDPKYPPVNIELWTFKEKEKLVPAKAPDGRRGKL